MMSRVHKKLVHEGDYAAEVEVRLIESDEAWSPYLSLEDAEKLDQVREALRQGDVRTASKLARVFHLTPVS
jgi:hypothetical protein